MSFDAARQIADAVLYEGYILYPYRASSMKNQFRWQWGLVAPRAWSEAGGEPWEMQTECLIEPLGSPSVEIAVRFFQIQVRTPLAEIKCPGDPRQPPVWEEGREHTASLGRVSLEDLAQAGAAIPIDIPGGRDVGWHDEALIGRERWRIHGVARLSAQRAGAYWKLRVRIENISDLPNAAIADRSVALRHSMAGTHTLLSVSEGAFVSLMDPPEAARSAAASCVNLRTWPVLVGQEGDRSVMLSSPIILEDYPKVAPESRAAFFDSTEIDELLTLRVMTMTDEEQREAAETDPRARKIIESCNAIPQPDFERLHGTLRSPAPAPAPFEDFFNPPGESPEQAFVEIGNARAGKGSRVRLRPARRSDSMDLFLAGRTARIQAVHRDLENRVHVAVTIEDDPAADLHGWYGRFFYFAPDELELLETGAPLQPLEQKES